MLIGVQSGGITQKFGYEFGYKMIRDAGFESIDLNMDQALPKERLLKSKELKDICILEKSLEEVLEYYAEELECIHKNQLIVSQAHAPFPPFVEDRPEILDYCIGIYNRCIEFCDAIGCKNLVIHGVSHDPGSKLTLADVKAINMKLYEGLIDTLERTNVTVCLENLPTKTKITGTMYELCAGICCDPYEAVEYIDTLNKKAGKKCFGFCLDTGHLNITKGRFNVFIPIIGDRLCALHIHDNIGIYDSHKAPYTGSLLWDEFIEGMKESGYDGDLSFETFRQITSVPKELAPAFLKLIFETGKYFKEKISE